MRKEDRSCFQPLALLRTTILGSACDEHCDHADNQSDTDEDRDGADDGVQSGCHVESLGNRVRLDDGDCDCGKENNSDDESDDTLSKSAYIESCHSCASCVSFISGHN